MKICPEVANIKVFVGDVNWIHESVINVYVAVPIPCVHLKDSMGTQHQTGTSMCSEGNTFGLKLYAAESNLDAGKSLITIFQCKMHTF